VQNIVARNNIIPKYNWKQHSNPEWSRESNSLWLSAL